MVETQITVTQSELVVKTSLIVVSNRLPFVLKKDPKTGALSRHARLILFIIYFIFLVICN